MHTITARSIRRGTPLAKVESSLLGFVKFLTDKKTTFNLTGRRPFGHRVMVLTRRLGSFATATFIHPTKKVTSGRISTIAWHVG